MLRQNNDIPSRVFLKINSLGQKLFVTFIIILVLKVLFNFKHSR